MGVGQSGNGLIGEGERGPLIGLSPFFIYKLGGEGGDFQITPKKLGFCILPSL